MNDVRGTVDVKLPEFNVYGTVKVGDRGQVVIPSDARKDLCIKPGDFLLVVSTPRRDGVALIRAQVVEEMMSRISAGLTMSDEETARTRAKKNRK